MSVERLKAEIVEVLDCLPPDSLDAVSKFVQFLREQQAQKKPPYTPVALGGLWRGVEITEEEIATIRKEMWASLEEQ